MKNIFEKIYLDKEWGEFPISGAGSDPLGANEYIELLMKFKDKNVLDIGCGDMSIYHNMFFSSYIGIDAVDFSDKILHFDKNVRFICSNIFDVDVHNMNVDLIIIKDVMQHLSNLWNEILLKKIMGISCTKIITNDYHNNEFNIDCAVGQYRPLNLIISPFNVKKAIEKPWLSKKDNRIKMSYICE
jgi:SAM-dependent methyltransferase